MALVTCRGLSLAYEGKTAVSGIDFEIKSGDYLCVVGPNGAGKSTLLLGLLRLMRPSAGSVSYGEGLTGSDIGYLPQQSALQRDFPAGAFEVVLSGRLARRGLRPFYSRRDKREALENMKTLGLEGFQKTCFGELSGGLQRRTLLARALCSARRLLILDEPAAGLDPASAGEMYAHIGGLNRSRGLAVVMVSHDIPGAVRHASHILHLDAGGSFFGRPAEYAASPQAERFLRGTGLEAGPDA